MTWEYCLKPFVVVTLSLLIAGTLVAIFFGPNIIWSLFNIPQMNPFFADLRVLTGAGDSMRMGLDPLYSNPGDPWNRELNHARVWQIIISFLALSSEDTLWIGVAFILLYVSGPLILFWRADFRTTIALTLVIFSPAALLGIERGNFDLLIFFLVCMAVLVSQRHSFGGVALILAAAALKFFPIFSAALFLREHIQKALILIGTLSAIFLAYLIANLEDLPQIFSSTDKGVTVMSFGARSHDKNVAFFPSLIPPIALLLTALTFFFTRSPNKYHSSNESTVEKDAFRVGSAIYVGTFLLGNNWSYRLIFLILVVPQLIMWIQGRDRDFRVPAIVCVLAVLFSMWSIFLDPIPLSGAVDELCNWILLPLLFLLFLQSVPNDYFRLETNRRC